MHVHFVGENDDGISVSSHHARALAEAEVDVSFDAEKHDEDSISRHADAVHLVSFEQMDNSLLRRVAVMRASGVPVVRFWTGRDLLWAEAHEGTRLVATALARLGVVQLCRTPDMVAALAALDIDASPGPTLSLNITSGQQPEPLPARFTVLCYLPSRQRDFCGGQLVDSLIRRMPDVRFLVLGDTNTDYSAAGNVESLGFVEDISRSIRRSTVTVQPRLDGTLSRLTLEMLCAGRHAVTRHAWPHCIRADSVDEFIEALRALRREPAFNLEGREEVCRAYDKSVSLDALLRIFTQCTKGASLNRRLRGGWGTVSAALRSPGILSRKSFAPLDVDTLPPEALAIRALVDARADKGAAAPA